MAYATLSSSRRYIVIYNFDSYPEMVVNSETFCFFVQKKQSIKFNFLYKNKNKRYYMSFSKEPSLSNVINIFANIEKPILDDCYICLESIGNDLTTNGAILPYKCRHPICISCLIRLNKLYNNSKSFVKSAFCGICRAGVNRYIIDSKDLCQVSYSRKQTIYVPWSTINEQTLFRDHIQHMLAHAY